MQYKLISLLCIVEVNSDETVRMKNEIVKLTIQT